MKCEYCGTVVKESENFCRNCGAKIEKKEILNEEPKQDQTVEQKPSKTFDVFAILGFIFSISIIIWACFTFLPGLVFSIIGLKSKSKKGFAIAGIIISITKVTVLLVLLIAFWGWIYANMLGVI